MQVCSPSTKGRARGGGMPCFLHLLWPSPLPTSERCRSQHHSPTLPAGPQTGTAVNLRPSFSNGAECPRAILCCENSMEGWDPNWPKLGASEPSFQQCTSLTKSPCNRSRYDLQFSPRTQSFVAFPHEKPHVKKMEQFQFLSAGPTSTWIYLKKHIYKHCLEISDHLSVQSKNLTHKH